MKSSTGSIRQGPDLTSDNDGRGSAAWQRSKEMSAKLNGTAAPPRSPDWGDYWPRAELPRATAVKAPLPPPRQRHALAARAPREPRQQRHVARSTSSADPGDPDP